MPTLRRSWVMAVATCLLSMLAACSSRPDDDGSTSWASETSLSTSVQETPAQPDPLVAETIVVTSPRSVDGTNRCSLISVESIASLVGLDATVAAVPNGTGCTFTGHGAGVAINAPGDRWSIVDVAAKHPEGKKVVVAGNTAWELGDAQFAECDIYVALAVAPVPLVLQVTIEGNPPLTGDELCPVARSVAEAAIAALPATNEGE